MRKKGFDAEVVLADSGILLERLLEPGYLIDTRQCRKVIGNMIHLSGNSGVGFDSGREAEPTDLGILGYAVMSCRTMRDTLMLWQQYSASLVGMMSRLDFEENADDGFYLRVVEPDNVDTVYIFCVEEIFAMMYRIGTFLAGGRPTVRKLEFAFPAPSYSQHYFDFFDCPIRFGAAETRAVLSKDWLNSPSRTTDEEFNKICVTHCGQIFQQIEHTGPITARLRDIFLKNPRAIPKLDEAAKRLGMSPRSLRRHLTEESSRYQKLVDAFRADLASEYFRSTQLSTKQVAFLLGYNDYGTFRRSFKLWTGLTTREYRARTLAA